MSIVIMSALISENYSCYTLNRQPSSSWNISRRWEVCSPNEILFIRVHQTSACHFSHLILAIWFRQDERENRFIPPLHSDKLCLCARYFHQQKALARIESARPSARWNSSAVGNHARNSESLGCQSRLPKQRPSAYPDRRKLELFPALYESILLGFQLGQAEPLVHFPANC